MEVVSVFDCGEGQKELSVVVNEDWDDGLEVEAGECVYPSLCDLFLEKVIIFGVFAVDCGWHPRLSWSEDYQG